MNEITPRGGSKARVGAALPLHLTGMDLSAIDAVTARFEIATVRDAADQLDLRYGVYRGSVAPKRWMFFLNGRTEWIEKYSYLAVDLALPPDCGFVTMDHRGQGASGGARAFVERYDEYGSDAKVVIDAVTKGAPYVVLSHSMGGLIALHATLSGHLKPTSIVMSSPLLGLPNEPVPRPVARQVARLLTAFHLGTLSTGGGKFTKIPFEENILTHHADLYRRMQTSPYPVSSATFAWVAATFAACTRCFVATDLARLTMPVLVMGGTKEAVVEFESLHRWVQAATAHAPAEVQLKLVPGARHELFSELPEFYRPALGAVRDWFADFLA